MAGVRSVRPSGDRALRRRLDRVVLTYLLAVLVSGLVARAGLSALSVGGGAMGVPWLVIGTGGVVGAGTIIVAARYARGGVGPAGVDPVRLDHAALLARLGRLLMLAVALGAAVTSVVLAPTSDRGLALAVGIGLAALLAVFALLAGDVTRAVEVAHRDHAASAAPTRTGPATP